jgi:hypothetical protein
MSNNFEGLNVKNKWFMGENSRISLKKSYYRYLFKRKLNNIVKFGSMNRFSDSNVRKFDRNNII